MASQAESSGPPYEPSLRNFRPVLWVVAAIFAVLAVVHVVLWIAWRGYSISGAAPGDYQPLQLNRGEVILREQALELEKYGWLNREEKTAHIPVERAMQLLAEHGAEPFFEIEVPDDPRYEQSE